MSQSPLIAEIVRFRLKPGSDPAQFAAAAGAIDGLLQGSGAVLARTLSEDQDGTWTDHILWTDLPSARAMAQKVMADPLAAPMMDMIAPEGLQLHHAEVRHQKE